MRQHRHGISFDIPDLSWRATKTIAYAALLFGTASLSAHLYQKRLEQTHQTDPIEADSDESLLEQAQKLPANIYQFFLTQFECLFHKPAPAATTFLNAEEPLTPDASKPTALFHPEADEELTAVQEATASTLRDTSPNSEQPAEGMPHSASAASVASSFDLVTRANFVPRSDGTQNPSPKTPAAQAGNTARLFSKAEQEHKKQTSYVGGNFNPMNWF